MLQARTAAAPSSHSLHTPPHMSQSQCSGPQQHVLSRHGVLMICSPAALLADAGAGHARQTLAKLHDPVLEPLRVDISKAQQQGT